MKNSRREEKLNEWKQLLEERERNKLTISEFCKQKNITASTFYYYQDLIKYPNKLSQKRSQDKEREKNARSIKPIKVLNSTVQLENKVIRINLPNSVQCIFPIEISIQEMKSIIEMLLSC